MHRLHSLALLGDCLGERIQWQENFLGEMLLGKAERSVGVDLPALHGIKLFSVDQEPGGALDLALAMDKQGWPCC